MDELPDLLRQLRHQIAMDSQLGVEALSPGTMDIADLDDSPQTSAQITIDSTPIPALDEQLPKDQAINLVNEGISQCQRCDRCRGRQHSLPGQTHLGTSLCFIAGDPEIDEDQQGTTCCGSAGKLLDNMLKAMSLNRKQVSIINIVRCRPQPFHQATQAEIETCRPWLEQQLNILQPAIICTLGNTSLQALSGDWQAGVTASRGKMFDWHGIPVMPTYDLNYLQRNPQAKVPAWKDLQEIMKYLGLKIPDKK